jgi:hypothetical protein
MIWIVVVAIAYSVLIYVYNKPAPIRFKAIPYEITAHYLDGTIASTTTLNRMESYPDEKQKDIWVKDALYYWWWPTYIAGNVIGGRWILRQKRRSLHWLWLTPLFPIALLIVDNKNIEEQNNV